MANEQFAFIDRASVPSREAWQRVISEAGFEFELDPSLNAFSDSGYRPCMLFGKPAGFEISYESAAVSIGYEAAIAALAPGRNYYISFRWGGSMHDCACVMIACYALAFGFGAVISYEGGAPYSSLGALLDDTRGIVSDAKRTTK